MARLRVDRMAHTRAPHTRIMSGRRVRVGMTRVPRSTFMITDRGARGRGPTIIPALKKGSLGVDFSKPPSTRRRIESALAKKKGEKVVAGKLQAVSTLNRRINKTVSRKAASDRNWVQGSFSGKKFVGFPRGFGRGT